MKENWVDFKAVKQSVSIEAVLSHYDVNWLRKNGKERKHPVNPSGG